MIALDLQPGRALLPALMDPLRALPGIPLACLAAGATLSWLERDDIEANPRLILEHERAVVVLNSDLRERLLMRTRAPEFDGLKADTWRRWLRDPSEPLDFERWKIFLARFGLRQTPGVNLLYDSASGGAILSSRPRTDAVHNWVTPPPGVPWQLSQVPPGLQPSLGSTGAFTTFDADWSPRGPGAILLAQDRFEWLYLGTWEPRRCGAWMPALEISQLVEDLAFIEQAALVTGAPGFESSPHSFTLLAFLGAQRREDETDAGKAWLEAIEEQISRRLGPVFQPDELRLVPLFARRQAGMTDQSWCQDLYASGSLERRLSSPLFWRLTKARAGALNRLDKSPKTAP